MARKNPVGVITKVTIDALLHPVGTAEKAVGQAKGTVAIGRMVAGQVTRTAAGAVGAVVSRGVSTDQPPADPASAPPTAVPVDTPSRPHGDPVRPLTSTPDLSSKEAPKKAPVKAPARKSATPDPSADEAGSAAKKTAPGKKTAPAKKTAPGKKAAPAAKKGAPAAKKGAPAAKKGAPAGKKAAAKAPAKKAAAVTPHAEDMPDAPGEPPRADVDVDVTPADVAQVVARAAAESPAEESPATSAQAAQEPAPGPSEDPVVYTSDSSDGAVPAGPSDPGHLEQPLLDPADAKAVRTEAETGERAADPDRG